jgi:hypothetical protein
MPRESVKQRMHLYRIENITISTSIFNTNSLRNIAFYGVMVLKKLSLLIVLWNSELGITGRSSNSEWEFTVAHMLEHPSV